ncbi:D-hexose-6-phosphate mutarotase [Thalassotalea ganghwensis]
MNNEFGSVSIDKSRSGIDIVKIIHSNCEAEISLYGGQVLHWQPKGGQAVFWLSKKASYQSGGAIRGGIPICWPWFGSYLNERNHGFARLQSWQVCDIQIDAQGVIVALELSGQHQSPVWPYAFKLTQIISFSEVFSQQMLIENLSDSDFQFGHAFHSYFRVSDPEKVRVAGLNTSDYDDKITGEKHQAAPLKNCKGPLDRIYYNNDRQTIEDELWQRKITVESTNCHQWVIWNPGKTLADNMSDIHPSGEKEYVCLEAANVKMQTVKSGQTIEVSQKVTVNRL